MERGQVRKGSCSVLRLFGRHSDCANDVQMTTQMTIYVSSCDEPKRGIDRVWKSCHLGRHFAGANDVPPKGRNCAIALGWLLYCHDIC